MRPALAFAILTAIGCQTPAAPAEIAATTETGFIETNGVRLSYRLDIPARTAPVGAVVFGHGSGRQTKHSCRFLADGFLARGFATLCYDKRGVGESTGTFVFVGADDSIPVFEELGSDLAAGVEWLRRRSEIDPARIGLSGVSQAGWISIRSRCWRHSTCRDCGCSAAKTAAFPHRQRWPSSTS